MIDLLLLLLRPALLCVEAKQYRYLPHAILAWSVDILIAHTTWRMAFGPLQSNEWTISHALERLCRDPAHPDYELFVQLAKKINRLSPTRDHIKAVLYV